MCKSNLDLLCVLLHDLSPSHNQLKALKRMANKSVLWTKFADFPPLYTIQTVEQTRERQLEIWRTFILEHCNENKITAMELEKFPLFKNDKIQRSVDLPGRRVIAEYLIKQNNGEWEDEKTKTRLLVYVTSIESIANEIYSWARENLRIGVISTLYEIHGGDDASANLQATSPELCLKAIKVLEKSGKAIIVHPSNDIDETGIKFV